ncbi:ammonium transporter Rh type C-like, partial [Penaeus indicus]|uniref:ammonium transporter Rh type C-like n=1 Tax=Penaeus indicus TaxID=29960 RepID=UPI00300CE085
MMSHAPAESPGRLREERHAPGMHLRGLSVSISRGHRPALGFSRLHAAGGSPDAEAGARGSGAPDGEEQPRGEEVSAKPIWWLTRTTSAMLLAQGVLVMLFTAYVRYHPLADAAYPGNNHHPILGGSKQDENPAHSLFSHVLHGHLVLLAGVGLRLVFLQEASYGSLGVAVLLAGATVQWAILCQGFMAGEDYVYLDIRSLLAAESSGLSACVSLSALVGVVSPLQMLLLSLVHAPLHAANQKLSEQVLK